MQLNLYLVMHAYNVLMGSTKSMTGHLLGAAGAVEAFSAFKPYVHNQVPPTINLDNPDEGCDLDYIRGQRRDVNLEYVYVIRLVLVGQMAH